MNPLPITDADVNAYVDGQLAPARMPAVEDAIARDPAVAQRIAELRAQNAALRDAFDPWLAEAPPARLVAAATGPAPARPRVPAWLGVSAAAAASLVIGVAVGWFGRDASLQRDGTPTTFTRQAALVHALYAGDANRPVEIWAAEEKRLVNWLSKRLGFAVHAPDLNPLGFALVGGRLVAGNELPDGAVRLRESGQAAADAAGPQAGRRPQRDRVPVRARGRRRRLLLDRRALQLRAVGQPRSRAAPDDRPRRLRTVGRAGSARGEVGRSASPLSGPPLQGAPSLAGEGCSRGPAHARGNSALAPAVRGDRGRWSRASRIPLPLPACGERVGVRGDRPCPRRARPLQWRLRPPPSSRVAPGTARRLRA